MRDSSQQGVWGGSRVTAKGVGEHCVSSVPSDALPSTRASCDPEPMNGETHKLTLKCVRFKR